MRYALAHFDNGEDEPYEKDGVRFIRFRGPCVVTGKEYAVDVPVDAVAAYMQGAHTQDVLPDMPAADREFLISGVSPEGFQLLCGVPADDSDEGDDE